MTGSRLLLGVVAVLANIATAVLSCKVLREYERGVVFRLGRVRPLCGGPGLRILIPLMDRMIASISGW